MRLSATDIVITSRPSRHGLSACIGERILRRAQLVPVEIPRTSRSSRVGVELRINGKHPISAFVNQRLLATAWDIMVHNDGTVSIPREHAHKTPIFHVAA